MTLILLLQIEEHKVVRVLPIPNFQLIILYGMVEEMEAVEVAVIFMGEKALPVPQVVF